MLSYDVVFKPNLLYQLLLRCPGKAVGVAEVRKISNSVKPKQKGKRSNKIGFSTFWGFKGIFWLGGTIFLRKLSSAMPVPHYLRSRSTIKRVSKLFGVPYDLVDDVNDAPYLEHLSLIKPDIIVSFQHQIFGEKLLSLPNIACINCHPAKLPEYRGVKPIFWAMLNGDEEIGVTVHTMEPKIDTGRIIIQKCFRVLKDSTLMDNYVMAYSTSADIITEALRMIGRNRDLNTLTTIPPTSKYYNNPNRTDLKCFKKAGLKII